MRKRMLALLLCISMLLPLFGGAMPLAFAEGTTVYHENIGRRARFDLTYSNFPIVDDPAPIAAEDVFSTSIAINADQIPADLVVIIRECYVNEEEGIYWYRVEAAEGHALPSVFPENAWVFQNYTAYTGGESLILLEEEPEATDPTETDPTETEPTEPDPTEPSETEPSEPETCPICGQAGCAALHFYCDLCEKHDCGLDHLYCSLCGKFDCTESHVWCGTCGRYDCGQTHEPPYTPPTSPRIPENPTLTEGAAVSIADENGEAVTSAGLSLSEGRKVSLSAWTDLSGDVTYQWQIRYDTARDLWADISGQTGRGILVSPAMFLPLLEERGEAAIRCIAISGGETRISDPIPLTVAAEPVRHSLSGTSDSADSGLSTAAEDGTNKVNLIIHYVFGDDNSIAANPWTATLPAGVAYTTVTPITVPMIPGYAPTVKDDHATLEGYQLSLSYSAEELQQDVNLYITYQPASVQVTVRHFWQNAEDDNYTLHATTTKELTTGTLVGNVHENYEGFYHLLYEHPEVAADGSTVIDIYYDRYYYLMTFELDGGYGIEPIYARYGAVIENQGEPIKPGYTFNNWLLNGNPYPVPKTMPAENMHFEAVWDIHSSAQVNVVIWGENPDDEGYSYQKTITIYKKPGETITWEDVQNEIHYTCGETVHTHVDECYGCGIPAHTHTENCYTCGAESHNHTTTCYNGVGTKLNDRPSNAPWNPSEGEVYRRNNNNYYIFIDGSWYRYTGNTASGSIAPTTCGKTESTHNHTDACLGCGVAAHTHTQNGCGVICGMTQHTHNASCEADGDIMDADLWELVESESVTVAADGSTVMNVYYDRKTFTLTFHYDYRSNNSYRSTSTITDKWGADIGARFLAVNSTANGNLWSTDTGGGSPWTSYLQIMPQNDEDYYCRSSSTNEQTAEYYTQNADGTYSLEYSVTAYYGSNLTISKEDFYEMEGFTYSHGTDGDGGSMPSPGSYGDFDGAKFYYDRHKYAIEFHSPTELIRTTTGVPYQAGLAEYDFVPTSDQAPVIYEPGSVVFAGWYLNPDCSGEEFILADHTMPSATADGAVALSLYAKWEPKSYGDIGLYLNENDAEAYLIFPDVKHGQFLGQVEEPEDENFIGWFYRDENGVEKAFDPANMPIKGAWRIYGKWSSDVLCAYEIFFALDKDNDGTADTDEDGNIIYVAKSISGSALAGNSKTFDAKGGNDLYEAYREGFFPNVASHTIELDAENEMTTFTFLYTAAGAVGYKVRYLEEGTNKELHAEVSYPDNKKAVVTENFIPISGYLPDAFQKTLVVVKDKENVITFYYTEDTQHGLYQVNHHTQNLDGETYTVYTTSTFTGVIGETYTAEPISIPGFTYYAEKSNPSGTLESGTALKLDLYYTRNEYEYTVRYLEYGTNKVLYEPDEEELPKAMYGQLITEYAVEITKDMDGDPDTVDYQLHPSSQNPQTATIEGEGKVLTFYYVRSTQTMTVTKLVEGRDTDQSFQFILTSTAADFAGTAYPYTIRDGEAEVGSDHLPVVDGKLTFNLQQGQTITIGNLPTAEYTLTEEPVAGYEVPDPQTDRLTTDKPLEMTVTNRALGADLTIKRTNAEAGQVFVYEVSGNNMSITVTVTGNNSTTIHDLPLGEYTVTQLNGWSWRYSDGSKTVTHNAGGSTVEFGGNWVDKWLNGNSPLRENVYGGGSR